MEYLRKKESWIYVINLIVLQMFFVQLFDFPNKIATVCGLLSCAVYAAIQKKFLCGVREVLVLVCFCLYVYFAGISWGQGISIILMPFLFQIMGRNLLASGADRGSAEKRLFFLLTVFVLGYFLHSVLNSALYLKDGINFHGRNWTDIWTGVLIPGTQQNIYSLPVLALVVWGALCIGKYTLLCICILAAAAYSIWFSVLTQSRTPLLVFGLVCVWGIILWMILNRNGENYKKQILMIGIGVLILAAAGGLLAWKNWDAVQSSAIYASLGRNGGILGNIRFEAQRSALKQIFVYPFGGRQMELPLRYAHNVWLDMANAAGVIPFFLFTAYTLFAAWDVWKLLSNPQASSEIKLVLSSLWIALVLYYSVEPALEATVQFIVPWMYINGLIYEYNRIVSRGDH